LTGLWDPEGSGRLKADSHIPCRSYAVPMPFPAVLKTDSHIPCRSPATTLPFPVSALFHTGHCIRDRYASDNKLPGTRSGKSPTCRQHAVTLPPRSCHERAMNLPLP
jgi:hypothetical protein